jgi:hypothetical protein
MKTICKGYLQTTHGKLLGFGATQKHICYFDLTSHCDKLITHHIVDEGHYGASSCPPEPQVLMNMGYELPTEKLTTGPIYP